MKEVMNIFNEYINEISKVKDELEHSGRTFLQNFLTEFANPHKVNIIQEPPRDKQGRGAPDFKFLLNDTDIGYLENKKIGENLDEVLKSDQIRKYKTLTDNLILTDYLRWIWIYNGKVVKDIRLCENTILEQKSIKLNEQNCNDLTDLINDFLSQKPQEIYKARDLADKLSKPTRTIKEEINDMLSNIESNAHSRIVGTFKVFQSEISEHITPEAFADAFAQTLTYSLFLTKITLTSQEKLTLANITNLTPKSFALIKDILAFINEIEEYPQLKPYVECLFHIINNTNVEEVIADLQNNKDEYEDPYIHFYENFLTAYDKEKRKELGVWYTPKPVVRSIINNIHEVLKQDFNLTEGFSNESVKVLDFACGTGTFLFEIYDKILSEVSKTSLKRRNLIKNHILKNIFGFELLIPAYCVSHLKLSQHLKDEDYTLEKDDRIKVYFTNTLENRHPDRQASLYENFFPAIAKEGREAQNIKDDKDILVITGNPPYNGTSQNNFEYIQNLIKPYFPHDDIKERNTKWLQDDYVKFIRFAENKIAKAGRGVVGVITSHSFLDNPTFRQMRKHLMETFDKIYTIDL
ncbi:MAG: putative helicase, partial [Candidatus Deianiraeaceae bacterium]